MRFRLAWKIGGWLALVFALLAFVGVDLMHDFSILHQEAFSIEAINQESHQLHELEMDLLHTVTPVRAFLINGDWRQRKTFEKNRHLMKAALQHISPEHPEIRQLTQAINNITAKARQVFSLPFASGNLEGPILMHEIDHIVGKASSDLSKRHHAMDQSVNSSMRNVSEMSVDIRKDIFYSILTLFFLLIGLTAYLYLHIIHPLVHLRRELKKISNGDFNIHCPELPMDELGELALACNTMGTALQEREIKLNHARNMAAHHEKMQALGLMAAGIAHEVGNPLAGASVSLETAMRKLRRGQVEEAGERIQIAMDELSRTETIIRNILDYGKSGIGSDLTHINIELVTQSAVMLARMAPNRHKIKIEIIFMASLTSVIGNASMLRQVLVNLLLNAMDVCEENGCIKLITKDLGDGIALNVYDNGSGIPLEYQEDIFKPMFTTKQTGMGSGIGLAISRELMERMHGRLELVSSNQSGSHFRAWLPSGHVT